MTSTTITRRIAFALLATALALGAACGDDDDEGTESAGQETATTTTRAAVTTTTLAGTTTTATANRITIQNFTFGGIDSTRAGDTWTVANQDTVPHTVSAVDGSFRWDAAGGETKTFTHSLAAGSYPIRCDIHPSRMTGTLVVR
jgi:plastocyanin